MFLAPQFLSYPNELWHACCCCLCEQKLRLKLLYFGPICQNFELNQKKIVPKKKTINRNFFV